MGLDRRSTSVFQHPFVDVLRLCSVDQWKDGDFEVDGNVTKSLDRCINKEVVRLRGSIPAANQLRMPKAREASLGLTGRFMYLQVLFSPSQHYAVHVETQTTDGNACRISVSDIYNTPGPERTSAGVQLPFVAQTQHWTLLCLDLATASAQNDRTAAPYQTIKAIQLCAWLSVRGLFTSDNRYTLETLPRGMLFCQGKPASDFCTVWLPAEPSDVQRALPPPRAARSPPIIPPRLPARPPPGRRAAPRPSGGEGPLADPGAGSRNGSCESSCTSDAEDDCNLPAQGSSSPALRLARLNAFNGDNPRQLIWPQGSEAFVLAAGSCLVAMGAGEDGRQRLLQGHTGNVSALTAGPAPTPGSSSGQLLASAQESPAPLIRVWDLPSGRCLAILDEHPRCVTSLDLSPDGRCLVGAGMDGQNKYLLVLWSVEGLQTGQAPRVIVRCSTSHDTQCVRWDPADPQRLMACGRCSIRSYRYKGGILHGMSIPYTQVEGVPDAPPLGSNTFTHIAFEAGSSSAQLQARRAFIASASGAVYQVSCERRVVEAVYQLHWGPINALLVHDGFAVTGSDDGFVRLWPLDFADFLLEAQHPSPVTAVGASPDGLRVVCGTEDRSIGVLDVISRQYTPLLRSHRAAVTALAVHPRGNEICTASTDGSLRLWALPTCRQTLGFEVPRDAVGTMTFHPSRPELVCGFASGLVRVFDVAAGSLLHTIRQHAARVADCVFNGRGDVLYSLGEDGVLCTYETARDYLPTASCAVGAPGAPIRMAVSPGAARLALVAVPPAYFGTLSCTEADTQVATMPQLTVRSGRTLEPELALSSCKQAPLLMLFLPGTDSGQIMSLEPDGHLRMTGLSTGACELDVDACHRLACNAMAVHASGSLVVTGGADRLIKLWRMTSTEGKPGISCISTLGGQPDAVAHVAFAGNHVVATGADGGIVVWEITSSDMVPNLPCTPAIGLAAAAA